MLQLFILRRLRAFFCFQLLQAMIQNIKVNAKVDTIPEIALDSGAFDDDNIYILISLGKTSYDGCVITNGSAHKEVKSVWERAVRPDPEGLMGTVLKNRAGAQADDDLNQQQYDIKARLFAEVLQQYLMKIIVFILVFLIAQAQDEQNSTIIGEPGEADNADVTVEAGNPNDLPPKAETPKSADGRPQALAITIAPQQPSDWTYLNQPIASSRWIHPNGSFVLYPQYRIYCYTITFYTDCPQNGATLVVAGTGAIFVQVNGTWLLTWGNPYPTFHKVFIPSSLLTCGCNKIRICVYNYWWPSPLAIIYSLSQSTAGCYNCRNLGVTFYNKRTCKCDCVQQCFCYNRLMYWADYPQCGCMCRQSLKCAANQYFDYQSCRCLCKPKCCEKGYYQHPSSCNCVRFIIFDNPQISAMGLRSSSQAESNSSGGIIQLDAQVDASPGN